MECAGEKKDTLDILFPTAIIYHKDGSRCGVWV